MERAVLVYTTYPSVVEAERAGRALVERRLCACVNILPGMISHYWWQGVVERGEEVVMIIKTRSSDIGAGRARAGRAPTLRLRQHPARHDFPLLVAGCGRARRGGGDDHQDPQLRYRSGPGARWSSADFAPASTSCPA